MPLTFDELFTDIPNIACKRFGPAADAFIDKYIEDLHLSEHTSEYNEFLKVMANDNIPIKDRHWIGLRRAKSFERSMDRVIMQVSVTNFKCQHGRMPTLEDILGSDDGFEDYHNHKCACEDYIEPNWSSDWPQAIRRRVMKIIMDYIADIYQKAVAEHSRFRSIAYSA